MKRLLLGALLCVAPLKAEGLADAWKELSKWRSTSAVKAASNIALMYYSGVMAYELGNEASTEIGNRDVNLALHAGVPAAGLSYVTWNLFWYYFIPQTKHALSIK